MGCRIASHKPEIVRSNRTHTKGYKKGTADPEGSAVPFSVALVSEPLDSASRMLLSIWFRVRIPGGSHEIPLKNPPTGGFSVARRVIWCFCGIGSLTAKTSILLKILLFSKVKRLGLAEVSWSIVLLITLLIMGSARILGAFRGPVRGRTWRAGPAGGAAVSGAASVGRATEGAAIGNGS
jgi:hypothetical protein